MEVEAARQRRLNRRLRSLVAGVAVLAMLGAVVSGIALLQWDRARGASAAAEAEADRALTEAQRARTQELLAGSLAALDEDPSRARILAVLAAESGGASLQSTNALHEAHSADRVVSRIGTTGERGWLVDAVLSADGGLVAFGGGLDVYDDFTGVEVRSASSGDVVWEYALPGGRGLRRAVTSRVRFSLDGDVLAVGVAWRPPQVWNNRDQVVRPRQEIGVQLWDMATQQRLGVVDLGVCGGWPAALSERHLLAYTLAPAEGQASDICPYGLAEVALELVDLRTRDRVRLGTLRQRDALAGGAMSGDGRVIAWSNPQNQLVVHSIADSTETRWDVTGHVQDVDATGKHVLVALPGEDEGTTGHPGFQEYPGFQGSQVIRVVDGAVVAQFRAPSPASPFARFAPDGRRALSSGLDGSLWEWDLVSGDPVRTTHAVGDGPISFGEGGEVLVARPQAGESTLIDMAPRGEPWTVPGCQGATRSGSLHHVGGDTFVQRACTDDDVGSPVEIFGAAGDRLAVSAGVSPAGLAIAPDGTRMLVQELPRPSEGFGRMVLRERRTMDVSLVLEEPCGDGMTWSWARCYAFPGEPSPLRPHRAAWSPDGRWVAVAVADQPLNQGGVLIWEASTGELVTTLGDETELVTEASGTVADVLFTPDSSYLVVAASTRLVSYDVATWHISGEATLGTAVQPPVLAGTGPDGEVVAVSRNEPDTTVDTGVTLLDPASMQIRDQVAGIIQTEVVAARSAPERDRVAMVTRDGSIAVWELGSANLSTQTDLGLGPLSDIVWTDARSVVVASETGALTTVAVDPEVLLALVRRQVTRELSGHECAQHALDPCPSLSELRGEEPAVPERAQGEYVLRWSAAELEAADLQAMEASWGRPLPVDLVTEAREGATQFAGTHLLRLQASTFEITRENPAEVACAGSVLTESSGRLVFTGHRGRWCSGASRAFEAHLVTDGEILRFEPSTFRGPDAIKLFLTDKPLERVG
jgi:WD40 repeat protein